jgi:Uma2 family endonuclease
MSSVPKPLFTEEEYLRREEASGYKNEYYRGEIFAMSGANPEHNVISSNLIAATHRQLDGGPCRPFGSDQRIKISGACLTTYPDLSIVCGRWQTDKVDKQAIINPQVIVEVLSPSTESYDRTKKFDLYKQLPSLQEYVLVSQDEPRIEQYVRQSDNTWNQRTFLTIDDTLALQTLSVRIPLSLVYQGLSFAAKPKSDNE